MIAPAIFVCCVFQIFVLEIGCFFVFGSDSLLSKRPSYICLLCYLFWKLSASVCLGVIHCLASARHMCLLCYLFWKLSACVRHRVLLFDFVIALACLTSRVHPWCFNIRPYEICVSTANDRPMDPWTVNSDHGGRQRRRGGCQRWPRGPSVAAPLRQ